MIRGVNKTVIEISDTGNECFERAILFVCPKAQKLDSEVLRARARQYLAVLKPPRGMWARPLRHWGLSALKLATAAAVGALVAALILGG